MITAKLRKGRLTLKVEGELTVYNAAEAKTPLLESLQGCRHVELDLAAVTELDTAGLQLLYLLRREAERQGAVFHIATQSGPAAAVLHFFNFGHWAAA